MYVFIYDIAYNGAIWPCHPSHSMPLALILLSQGGINEYVCVCVCVLLGLMAVNQSILPVDQNTGFLAQFQNLDFRNRARAACWFS